MDSQNTESINSNAGEASSFEQKVYEVVGAMKKDENGKYQLPEGDYPEEVKVAARLERRRRSTDSTISKLHTKLKVFENVNGKLTSQILARPELKLSAEEQKRLSDLMYDDPKTWRDEMNKLELSATSSLKDEINTIATEASQQAELEARTEILEQFNRDFPDANFTDDLLERELPARMWSGLKNGDVSFKKFLYDANDFINKTKKVASQDVGKQPNLGKMGGGSTPSMDSLKSQQKLDYSKVKF